MADDQIIGRVANWPFEKRLEETFTRTLPKLGPEARQQLAAIITPEALAIVATVLVAWVVSHAFGFGEIIDIIIVVVGAFAIGLAVFDGLDHLYDFAVQTYYTTTENDLNTAADHLAKAISILGIQAVLAVLFRGSPRTGHGGRINIGPAPPRTPGIRYRPTITRDPNLAAGHGFTSFWGDITVSTRGTANDRNLVLVHEKVHQFLAPKLYTLRNFRVSNRVGSYFRSSLWRFVEEALAETVAQVGVNGIKQFFVGVRFPVQNGYVYMTRGGGYSAHMAGGGIVPEGAALVSSGIVMGISFQLWFAPR
ncbi:MAG TPA: hypothetical protein GX399_10730 [Xanthomonadaceae bacterium]|nr:hypothetical protein [Xanthomonadaceae bacterium]